MYSNELQCLILSVSPVGSFHVCLFRVSCPHPVWLSGFSCLLILSVPLSYFLSLNRFCNSRVSLLIFLSVPLVLSCLIILSVSLVPLVSFHPVWFSRFILSHHPVCLSRASCLPSSCLSLSFYLVSSSCLSLSFYLVLSSCLFLSSFLSPHPVCISRASCLPILSVSPSCLLVFLSCLSSLLFLVSKLFLWLSCFSSPLPVRYSHFTLSHHPVWLSQASCLLILSVFLRLPVSSSCLFLLACLLSCLLISCFLLPHHVWLSDVSCLLILSVSNGFFFFLSPYSFPFLFVLSVLVFLSPYPVFLLWHTFLSVYFVFLMSSSCLSLSWSLSPNFVCLSYNLLSTICPFFYLFPPYPICGKEEERLAVIWIQAVVWFMHWNLTFLNFANISSSETTFYPQPLPHFPPWNSNTVQRTPCVVEFTYRGCKLLTVCKLFNYGLFSLLTCR